MAVTRIWPVRGKIAQVIDYVRNPEKTDAALTDAIGYAMDDDKTEKGLYVSGVNCTPEDASEEFTLVKHQFDKEGGIVAYHAYQSFSAGEVTPEQAHAIGTEFAGKVWGEGFQVVVATHLNTGCLHNHFVVNSVSFADGKRCRQKQWRELSRISDETCKAHELPVVENAKGKRIPLPIYKAEQEGKATRLNLAKVAVDEALTRSRNLMELEINLRQMGYLCRFDRNRKYWTIRQRDWERPIRLIRMGEAYSNERLMARLKEQKRDPMMQYLPEKKPRQYDLPIRKDKLKRLGGLKGLYLHYCYLLGYLPRHQNQQNPKRIHYLYRDDLLKLKNISDEAQLLYANGIETKAQLLNLKEHFESEIQRAAEKRNCYRNEIRRVGKTETEIQRGKEAITSLTVEMRVLRRQVHLCEHILSRSAQMEKKVKKAEREEKRERSDER